MKKKKSILQGVIEKEEAREIVESLSEHLKSIFRKHIGEHQAISAYDLFEALFKVDPESVDVYKRMYWWNVVRQLLRKMRMSGELFVINQKRMLYVLSTYEESLVYKTNIDLTIARLEEAKHKAEEWLEGEKWKTF